MRREVSQIWPIKQRGMEFLYVLLLFSGHIKGYLVLIGLDKLDFTVIISFILSTILIINLVRSSSQRTISLREVFGLISILALIFSFCFSLLYTSSTSFYLNKTLGFGVSVLAYLFPILAYGFNSQKFLNYFINISVVYTASFIILFFLTREISDLEGIHSMYLAAGYICGINILLLTQMPDRGFLIKIFFVFVLLLSGARGAILITVLLYFIILLTSRHELKKIFNIKVFTIVLPIVILLSTSLLQSENFSWMLERSINRTILLFSDDMGNSANVRSSQAFEAVNYIAERPFFGYGTASYGVVTRGEDIRAYPHNSILEVWFEMGLFGLVSYLLFTFFHIFQAFYRVNSVAGAVLLYLFFNSLKSSSFTELKFMYGFFAIFLVMHGASFMTRRSNESDKLK
jgi:O-antigen ligase